MEKHTLKAILKLSAVVSLVYLFLISIGLMSAAFKGFGHGFAENLIRTTANPFIGIFIGILATSLVQSSSTTTSIVVGIVSSGVITVQNSIPIIMGANIGTTVTNTMVSLGHIGRKEEFKRAITGGTVHDFFNIMCVSILFPLELTTGVLSKSASFLTRLFTNCGGIQFTSPLKIATQPVINLIKAMVISLPLSHRVNYLIILGISITFLFTALYFIVKIMNSLVVKRAEIVFNNIVGRHGVLTVLAGFLFTAIIQSSSITTSLMIPLIAAGVLSVETVFPIIMGANIGTTVTAILASFATANPAAITVAFVHFLFNIIGVCLFYPFKQLRNIPIFLAKKLGEMSFRKRRYALFYVTGIFFIIPVILIFLSKIF